MKKITTISNIVKLFDLIINAITTLILVLFILVGCYALYDSYHISESAKLDDDILSISPKKDDDIETFSLESLRELNENIVGWIAIDNTNIDYPILYASDNSKYLDLDYHDEYSSAGSIFLDYRNNSFLDDYSIIYGHHMSSGRMFSDIIKFDNIDYFNTHKTGKLYTENGIYNLEIYSYAIVNAFDDAIYNLTFYKNNNNSLVVDQIKKNAVFKRELDFGDSKILLLSTCNAEIKNNREVLLAKLSLSLSNDDIITKQDTSPKRATFEVKVNKEPKREYKEKFNIFSRFGMIILLCIVVIIIYIILFIRLCKKGTKLSLFSNIKCKIMKK